MHDARAITNFILDYCEFRQRSITQLQLHKILYFCHVWHLVETGRPLVKQSFEAWEYGPVLPFIYRQFKEFENRQINKKALKLNRANGRKEIVEYDLSDDVYDTLGGIVDFYSQMSAHDLVEMTHIAGGPWDIVWNHEGKANPGMCINNEEIIRFYSDSKNIFVTQ